MEQIDKRNRKGKENPCFVDRIGEEFTTNEGYKAEIIEYFGWDNCTIKLSDGTILYNIYYHSLKTGNVRNPNHKSLYGVGYIGIGLYTSATHKKFYQVWSSMITRGYYKIYSGLFPTYIHVTVCREWECFQNFAKWLEENYKEGFHLDKDILVKGNKIYSPETCCFVPHEINMLFTKRQNKRGDYPIGVTFNKSLNKYTAQFSHKNGVQRHLGVFNISEEAFQSYKTAKEAYIKEIADKWRGQITEEVYRAMYNYKVEITD